MSSEIGDNPAPPKRTRVAVACHLCQRKKIKCDGKVPTCTRCNQIGIDCTYPQVQKKPPVRKSAKQIKALEERLRNMETLIQRSGIAMEGGNASQNNQQETSRARQEREPSVIASPPASPGYNQDHESCDNTVELDNGTPELFGDANSVRVETERDDCLRTNESLSTDDSLMVDDVLLRMEDNQQQAQSALIEDTPFVAEDPTEKDFKALLQIMCPLAANATTDRRSRMGLSVLSPNGIQWVNDKLGNSSFKQALSTAAVDTSRLDYWRPDTFADIFPRTVIRRLPPKVEAVVLVDYFFRNFNPFFPLFHEPTFKYNLDRQYSSEPPENPGWWASLNVVFAISHRRMQVKNAFTAPLDVQRAWDYIKNALAIVPELTFRNPDLLCVQALLGMAVFMQGTLNPRPASYLVNTAIRLSHALGLHRYPSASEKQLDSVEAEQRNRVFWIAYRLDKVTSLRMGCPMAQDDDDMNVDLPKEFPEDNLGMVSLPDGNGQINLFRVMSELALIESKVYKRLFSVDATRQSEEEILYRIGDLDYELEEWRESLSPEFQPESDIDVSNTAVGHHMVFLSLAYYNCLNSIHRMSVPVDYWTSGISRTPQGEKPFNPRVFSSSAICVDAARATIRLIKFVPEGDYGFIWLILSFLVSSLLTLFSHILQNPTDPRSRSDLKVMNSLIEFLKNLQQEEHHFVERMYRVCSELERTARNVLDRADESSPYKRRKLRNSRVSISKDPSSTTKPRQPAPQITAPSTLPSDSLRTPMSIDSEPSISSSQQTGSRPTPVPQNFNSLLNFMPSGNSPFLSGAGWEGAGDFFGSTMGGAVTTSFPSGVNLPWNPNLVHPPLFQQDITIPDDFDWGLDIGE